MIFEVLDIVNTMRKQGIEPDVVTYSILVDAYCKKGVISKAEDIVDSMKKLGIEPDVVTYNILVNAHCKEGMVPKLKILFTR
ncbi:hypothetical protein Goari_002822 [Gossypium aridum]|uniref:Pentatricopeptide repeat-containing protein n=1 Tax=Gossypium aridum TaxID=34290 RepID=A0A7J8YAD4_GOSAI|nr:hypothetical protein [Gossypium aridum]